jgi:phenylpyruvate tautomerase PptA (4-oxalocrotonate tautomerase family)
MPILDIEVVGQQAGDPPTEKLAERIAQSVGKALGVPSGQLWVKVGKVSAMSYAENGPPSGVLPVFVRVLVRTRDPSVWPKRAESICAAVSEATNRNRTAVHVIFEPDATGRVFFGGVPESRSSP